MEKEKMIVELQLFQYRIVLTAAKTEVIEGVYSSLENDMHFLMWDFDDIDFELLAASIRTIQRQYDLPTVYIMETKKEKSYHGYCLFSVTFQRACEIIAATQGIDMRFYTAGVMRHKWTLRIGEKSRREIKPLYHLRTGVEETVKIEEIKNFCTYKTPGDNHKTRIFKLGGE